MQLQSPDGEVPRGEEEPLPVPQVDGQSAQGSPAGCRLRCMWGILRAYNVAGRLTFAQGAGVMAHHEHSRHARASTRDISAYWPAPGKFQEIKDLARAPRFICFNCGRVAECDVNLCNPMPLDG